MTDQRGDLRLEGLIFGQFVHARTNRSDFSAHSFITALCAVIRDSKRHSCIEKIFPLRVQTWKGLA